mgnify:CR=1 FL=1
MNCPGCKPCRAILTRYANALCQRAIPARSPRGCCGHLLFNLSQQMGDGLAEGEHLDEFLPCLWDALKVVQA